MKFKRVIGLLSTTPLSMVSLVVPKTSNGLSKTDLVQPVLDNPIDEVPNETIELVPDEPINDAPSKTDIGELIGGTNIGSIYTVPSVSKGFLNTVLGKISEVVPVFSTICTTGFSISAYSNNGCTITVDDDTNPLYYGTANIIYTYDNGLKPLSEDITTLDISSGESWNELPDRVHLLLQLKAINPNVNLNQVSVNVYDIKYNSSTNKYYVALGAINNSTVYDSSNVTITFNVNGYQETTLLGLKFVYHHTYNVVTASSNVITLNTDDEYTVSSVDDTITNRSINIPDNYVNTTLNIAGDHFPIQPTSGVSPITIGENADVTLNVNSTDTNLVAPAPYAGIRVPYSSQLTIEGSSTLTVVGGDTSSGAGAGIGGRGGKGINGDGNDPNSYLNCGTINIIDSVSVTATGGNNKGGDCGGCSPGIGGAGCFGGYAGRLKSININTTGTVTATGGNSASYAYGSTAPGIGGGTVGRFNEGSSYIGGDLENFTLINGTVISQQGSVSGVIGRGAALGGGSATISRGQNISGGPYYVKAGDLLNFNMSGGKLIVINNNNDMGYPAYSGGVGATIGGGCTYAYNGSTGFANSESRFIQGKLANFTLTGGNVYAIDKASEGYIIKQHNNIGNGSLSASNTTSFNSNTVEGVVIEAPTPNITITGGSISQGRRYDMPTPANSSSTSLYPCFIPKTLNGSDTNGMSITTTAGGKTYSATVSDLTSYCANDYYGAIYLPVGSYSIKVGGLNCTATVAAQTTTDGTSNIIIY